MLAAQLLHALTFGALHVAGMGFITRAVEPDARGRAVSLYNAFGFGMPGLLGGVLGGQILKYLGFSTLFWVFALPPAMGALIGIVFGRSITEPGTRRGDRVPLPLVRVAVETGDGAGCTERNIAGAPCRAHQKKRPPNGGLHAERLRVLLRVELDDELLFGDRRDDIARGIHFHPALQIVA